MKKNGFIFLFYFFVSTSLWGMSMPESEIDSLNNVAWNISLDDPDEAIRLSQLALKESKAIDYLKGQSTSFNYLGIFYTDLSKFPEAEEAFLNAIEVRRSMEYIAGIAYVYDNLSRLKKEEGDYPKAIEYGFEALEILSSLGKEKEEPTLYLNLAIVHHYNQDTEDALKYFREGLKIAQQRKDAENTASIHYNLGNLYRETDQLDSAQIHYDKALPVFIDIGHDIGEAAIYDCFGDIHIKKNNFREAKEWFEKSIVINEERKDSLRLFYNYYNVSRLESELGNYTKALQFCQQAEAVSVNIEKVDDQEKLAREYGKIYENLNQPQQAIDYYKKAETLKDSIFNKEKNENILKLQKEEAEREKTIAELQKAEEENKNQKLIAMLAIIALLSILGFFILNQRRLDKARELKNYRDRQEQEMNRKIIEGTNKIRKELSHNLHNHVSTPLTHIKRFIEPAYKNLAFDSELQENLLQAIRIADKTHVLSRDISYKLRPEDIDWIDRIKLSLLSLERKEGVYTDLKLKGLNEKSFTKTDGEKISSIIGNIISNVDKHSRATRVEIDIQQFQDQLIIKVEDNGVGFDPEKVKGIGLESIRSDVEKAGGSIEIRSGIDKGTVVNVQIPVQA